MRHLSISRQKKILSAHAQPQSPIRAFLSLPLSLSLSLTTPTPTQPPTPTCAVTQLWCAQVECVECHSLFRGIKKKYTNKKYINTSRVRPCRMRRLSGIMCVCVCVCVYTYVYIYVHIIVRACVCVCVCVCVSHSTKILASKAMSGILASEDFKTGRNSQKHYT